MRLLLRRFPAWQLPGGLLLFALLCAAALAGPKNFRGNAATLTVTTTADSGAGSLRGAIAATSDGDTIQFDAALNGQSIMLTSDELAINKNITVDGPGADQLAVTRSSGTFRIFHILPGHTVIIKGLTISGGNGTYGSGLANESSMVAIDRCVVQDCSAQGSYGGGVYTNASPFEDANLTVLNSTIRNNYAYAAGGGIYIQASSTSHALVSIINSVVSNNTTGNVGATGFGSGSGGGISNGGETSITNSIVSGNESGASTGPQFPFGDGGGISNFGVVAIDNSTINGNSAGINGGGIYNGSGLVMIGSSTVSGNRATGLHDGHGWGDGGGMYNGGSMTIDNSTLSNNDATWSGGGVGNRGGLTIRHTTLGGNTAFEGGGIANNNNATLVIGNTILKAGAAPGVNIQNNSGTVTSQGYNLSSDNGAGFLTASGDQINTDPILGALQNNGGPTFTHDLLTGSPALDAGDPNFTPPPSTDQRGYARVFSGRVDIGSLEVQPTLPITISGTISYCSNPVPGPVPNVTLTLTGSMSGSTLSNGSGNYMLSSLPSGGSYTVTPTKPALTPGSAGITIVDAIATEKHFLGIGTPLSGCRLAAADVNGDAAVNTVDVVAIQRFFLGLSTGTANVGKYQFSPVSRSYPGPVSNQTGQNYDTLVFGDVVAPFAEP
jgi:hypothetical protein